MIRKLTATDNDVATTILRLVLGVIFFAHGAQKLLGWFGGYGFTGTMGFFTGVMHIPAVFAFLAIAAEFLGGLGLIFGLFMILLGIILLGIAVPGMLYEFYLGRGALMKAGGPDHTFH